jgi:hypothetical protein
MVDILVKIIRAIKTRIGAATVEQIATSPRALYLCDFLFSPSWPLFRNSSI